MFSKSDDLGRNILKRRTLLLSILIIGLSITCFSQKARTKVRYGKICADPTVTCKGQGDFQPGDLVFDTGKNFVIYESEPFYGIVLKSVKLSDWGDCEKPSFKEPERAQIQTDFSHNKVFMLNCFEAGTNYYTGVADKTAFIAVYAGRTLSEANTFLKTVQGTNRYPGVKVRKMRIGVNGT
jgi:hypothetical protein